MIWIGDAIWIDAPFSGSAEALRWTAMVITTLGSHDWQQTTEGRLLTLLLSVYAVGVFGYLAGSLASAFIHRQGWQAADDPDGSRRPS